MRAYRKMVTTLFAFNGIVIVMIFYVNQRLRDESPAGFPVYRGARAKTFIDTFRGPWTFHTSTCEECQNYPTGMPEIHPTFLPGMKNPCWYNNEGKLKCLPYFYLAGFPKCATTNLYKKIISHPDIIPATVKETHFFESRFEIKNDMMSITKNGTMAQYTNFFQPLSMLLKSNTSRRTQMITGDGSPTTLWSNVHWWRLRENCGLKEPKFLTQHYIRHILPQAKIIITMRNPTDRLYSGYHHFHLWFKSPDDFHHLVVKSITAFESCVAESSVRACTYNDTIHAVGVENVRLQVGLYHVYIEDWIYLFPRQQPHIIKYEEYAARGLETLKDIWNFLEMTQREQGRCCCCCC